MKNSSTVKIAFLVCCLAGLMACKSVYYNTFYNARKQYRLADQKRHEIEQPGSRLTPGVYKQLYMIAIKKASAVLELHPTSKWVDDSILLIGKAFYWRGEYTEALTKFREMQENFPNSSLIPETRYWQGLTLWGLGQVNSARAVLNAFGSASGKEIFGRAQLALAEIEASENNDAEAVAIYRNLLESQGKKHPLRAQIWQGIGNSLLHLEQYDGALEAYRQVLKSRPERIIDFETRLQIGTTLEQQGRLDEAMQTYTRMLKAKRLRRYEAETRLKQANLYRLKGQFEAALEAYETIVQKNVRTKYSAEAYYQMGLIEQKYRKDLEQAKSFFELASKESRASDAGQRALQRQKDLVILERYRVQIADAKNPQKSLAALFNMAELYLFHLEEPDSALAAYQRALVVADSTEFAPKALYAIGLIYADSLNQADMARKTFQTLIEAHSTTPYAVEARTRIQHNRTDDALAEARFLEAETLRQEGAAVEDYLPIFEQIATEYPQSIFAPKALYNLAWMYENNLDQLEQAKVNYQKVVDQYPMTAFAEIAGEKLKGGFLKPPAPPADTTRAETAPATDTNPPQPKRPPQPPPKDIALTADEVDQKPQLLNSVPPDYDPENRAEVVAERMDGKVVLNVLVGKDGKVRRAEIVSGPEVLHGGAIMAATQYQFKPAVHKGVPQDVWVEIVIPFRPTQTTDKP